MPRRRPPERATAVGRLLREAREAVGLRQADVAEATGRSRPVVSRWESGEIEPDAADVIVLGRILELSPGAVLGLSPNWGRSRQRRGDGAPGPVIGRALHRGRLAAEIDAVELSTRARVSPRRLARLEAGTSPSLAELSRLLDALGTDLDELVARAAES